MCHFQPVILVIFGMQSQFCFLHKIKTSSNGLGLVEEPLTNCCHLLVGSSLQIGATSLVLQLTVEEILDVDVHHLGEEIGQSQQNSVSTQCAINPSCQAFVIEVLQFFFGELLNSFLGEVEC